MEKRTILIIVAVALVALILLCCCLAITVALVRVYAGAPQRAIVGGWREAGSGVTMRFYADGTVSFSDGQFTLSGRYSFVDNDTLRLEMDGLWGAGGAQLLGVRVSRNRLFLTEPNGQTTELTRID